MLVGSAFSMIYMRPARVTLLPVADKIVEHNFSGGSWHIDS